MSSQPALAVIVPMHDVRRYLDQLVATAARNERRDIEFVFVDDRSTDGSAELAERLITRLPAARVLHHDGARGSYAARNAGIRATTAPAIMFADADDWFAPHYLDDALALWEARDVDVMRFDITRATGTQRELRRVPVADRGVVIDPRRYILPVHRQSLPDYPTVWAGLIGREFLERESLQFSEEWETAADREWWWRVLLAGPRLSVESLNGYFYRRDVPTSLTRIGDERQLHYLGVSQSIIERVAADRESERLLPKAWRTAMSLALFHGKREERFTDELRAAHEARVRSLLAGVEPAVARRAVLGLPPITVTKLEELGVRVR